MKMVQAMCTLVKWCAKSSKQYVSFMAMFLLFLNLYFRSIVISFTSESSVPLLSTNFILSPQKITKVRLNPFLVQWHHLHSVNVGMNCSSDVWDEVFFRNKQTIPNFDFCVHFTLWHIKSLLRKTVNIMVSLLLL